MIFLTGDTHGVQNRMTQLIQQLRRWDDTDLKYLIVCGDFGYIMENSCAEQRFLDDIACLADIQVLFLDGNHECFPYLNSLDIVPWHGGLVHVLRHNIIHLMRGCSFEIDGKSFFTFGGAASVDRAFREKYQQLHSAAIWWPDELPSREEYSRGYDCLAAKGNRVDYILTHTAPGTAQTAMGLPQCQEEAPLNHYLDEIQKDVDFKHWFFGHYHIDRSETIQGKTFSCVYRQVVRLG